MWSVSPNAADSVHDSGGCTYDRTTRVKAAPPKTLLPHRDPAPSPPTQFHHFSYSFTGSFRAPPRAPPRSLSLEGWRGRGARGRVWGVARQSPHQGLHLEGPDRTFGFWPSLSSAHRPIEQQQQQQLERPEQGSQGHDQTWLGYRGTRTGCARAGLPGHLSSRPDWYGRVARSELLLPLLVPTS